MEKTILIGVDGATFDLLEPWMSNGYLPNFAEIDEQGVSQTLETVVPTQSVPAWVSFNSGKNPAKHGLFAFNEDVKRDVENLIDSSDLPSHRFWDVLAKGGTTPGVVANVQTYPPRELERGFEVAGSQTPKAAEVFTHPEQLSNEIKEVLPDYEFGPEIVGNRKNIQKECIDSIRDRADVSQYLMKKKEWDYFSVVFRATDSAQHKLWNTPEMIREVFQHVDDFIGWVRSEYPKANVLLISDHGFTDPANREFFLETWLNENVDEKSSTSQRKKYSIAKRGYSLVSRTTGVNLRNLIPVKLENWLTEEAGGDKQSAIRAADNTHIDGVWISSELANYESIREKIMDNLLAVKDPETGRNVIRSVWKRENKYCGEWLDEIPDVVVQPYPEYNVNPNSFTEVFGVFPGVDNEGTHDAAPHGIFMASGPDIRKKNSIDSANILDVPPTILHLCRVPIPEDYDGSVLTDCLTGEAAERSIQKQPPLDYDRKKELNNNDVENREDVEDRLESLGYI